MRLLITGAGGMLGSSLYPALLREGHTVLATDIVDPSLQVLDVREYQHVLDTARTFKPDMIFHLSAMTDLEDCERDPDQAYLTNTLGTQNVVIVCQQMNIPMVYISTAGVFDGEKEGFYHEFDEAKPINVYGKTKFEGEKIVEKLLSKYFIVRAGWMIGGGKKDKKFIMKIIKQLDEGKKELHVVDDKFGTPTYTEDFSSCLSKLILTPYYGLYHMVCTGSGTRYDVAEELLKFLGRTDVKLVKVSSDFFKEQYFANRPRSEMMRNMMLDLRNMNTMREWREALHHYLNAHFSDRKVLNAEK